MPVVPLAVALALGIWVASVIWDVAGTRCDVPALLFLHTHPELARALALIPLLFLGLAFLWREDKARSRALVVLYLCMGMMLYLARPFSPCFASTHIAHLADTLEDGGTVVLTGVISGWPDVRPYEVRYRVRVEEARWQEKRAAMWGEVLVRGPRYPVHHYGDQVRVIGRLSRPPVFENFNYRRYLARQGIYALLRAERIVPLAAGHGSRFWAALYGLRARAAAVIDATLPQPYAALANGILLGIESDIPRDLYADFNATGTSHIIVISGFNIAIVAGLFLALLTPLLGERRAALGAIVGIGMYVLLVGADAAVVRAGIMGGIFAASRVLRRQTHALNSLFASALLMLALNPLTLWDVGFQLSFLATLGLITVLPPLQERFRRVLLRFFPQQVGEPAFDLLNEAVVVTMAAQITTAPLIMAIFGRVSLVSLFANALILPVQPLVMIGAGVSTLAGMLWLPLGQALSLVPLLPLVWTVAVVRMTAYWPGAGAAVTPLVRSLVLPYYLGLAAFVYIRYMTLLGRPWLPDRLALAFEQMLLARVRVWQPSRRWGLALLMLMPAASLFLVDDASTLILLRGGHAVVRGANTVPLVIPSRGAHVKSPLVEMSNLAGEGPSPAIWVLTHTEPETLAALTLLWHQTRPKAIILPPLCVKGWPCPEKMPLFLHRVDEANILRVVIAPGQWWRLGTLQVMYPLVPRKRQRVHPVLVRIRGIDVLLPEDVPPTEQVRLARQLGRWRGRDVPLVWVLPFPKSGTWPMAEALEEMQPSLLLYPEGVTYPPASAHMVSQFPRWSFDPSRGARVRVQGEAHLTLGPSSP